MGSRRGRCGNVGQRDGGGPAEQRGGGESRRGRCARGDAYHQWCAGAEPDRDAPPAVVVAGGSRRRRHGDAVHSQPDGHQGPTENTAHRRCVHPPGPSDTNVSATAPLLPCTCAALSDRAGAVTQGSANSNPPPCMLSRARPLPISRPAPGTIRPTGQRRRTDGRTAESFPTGRTRTRGLPRSLRWRRSRTSRPSHLPAGAIRRHGWSGTTSGESCA